MQLGRSGFHDEVDHHAFFALIEIVDLDLLAITRLHLLQQGNRVVVIDEAHAFAWLQGVERAEDRGMAKPLGDPARVKTVDAVGPVMVVDEGLGGNRNIHVQVLEVKVCGNA